MGQFSQVVSDKEPLTQDRLLRYLDACAGEGLPPQVSLDAQAGTGDGGGGHSLHAVSQPQGVESTACYVEQAGPLSSPILLDVQGGELQELIDKWNMQSAIHALDRHSGIVSLQ